jgi:hypothetical protein
MIAALGMDSLQARRMALPRAMMRRLEK